jgi:hypothetical protein
MPVTIGLVAAGTQAAVGLGQALFSGRKKKEADLNAFAKQSPLAQESKSLNDYYQQALNRYQENPYQSQQYQLGAMNAQRATAQGIGALQDRRSAIGGIGRLAAGQQTAMQNLGAQAEAQRNARFGQLGQATQAKTAQEKYLFDINQMTPYNRQLQLKQYGAQAANERYNAGLQMFGGALGNAAQIGAMSAYNKPVTQQPQLGPSSESTFNSWMSNPSSRPQLDTSLIQKTQGLSNKRLYGASALFPNAYTTY